MQTAEFENGALTEPPPLFIIRASNKRFIYFPQKKKHLNFAKGD
jgi:hypothetical protein